MRGQIIFMRERETLLQFRREMKKSDSLFGVVKWRVSGVDRYVEKCSKNDVGEVLWACSRGNWVSLHVVNEGLL